MPDTNKVEKSAPIVSDQPVKTPNIHISKRGGSALSLKSIQQKKEFEKNKKKLVATHAKDLPKDTFSEKELLKLWNEFGRKKEKQGERFLASTFAMHKPKLREGNIVSVEVPNQGMQVDIERIRVPLLEYFHESLNNYSVDIKVVVNEVISEEHAYTKEDKYKKLKDKNPLIDLLRTKFDLEL